MTDAGINCGPAVRARKLSVDRTSAVEFERTTRPAWCTSAPDMPPEQATFELMPAEHLIAIAAAPGD